MHSYSRITISLSPLETQCVDFLLSFYTLPYRTQGHSSPYKRVSMKCVKGKTQAFVASKECYILAIALQGQ